MVSFHQTVIFLYKFVQKIRFYFFRINLNDKLNYRNRTTVFYALTHEIFPT